MSGSPLRIAAAGAGQALQRLYLPALAGLDGLRLEAVADPRAEALARVPTGVGAFESLDALMDSGPFDGLLILSPAALHADHASMALKRGLPVLLEKPSARDESELASWPEDWGAMVTPARPRRYWREYLALRKRARDWSSLALALHTSPAGWGATVVDPPEGDILPHLIDLAGWLSRSKVTAIHGDTGPAAASGVMELADGRRVAWEAIHGEGYDERITVDGEVHDLARTPIRARIERRLFGRPQRDVEGVRRMLRLWARRLRSEEPPGLPSFETALEEVRLRAALNAPAADHGD